MMPTAELEELAADIKRNGLQEPIWVYEGQVLDGRNRLKACELVNVAPEFNDFDGDDPITFVMSNNLHRRHLTPSQKAAVATASLPLFEEQAKARQKDHGGTAPGKKNNTSGNNSGSDARDQAAKAVGVNPRYVSDAKKIKEEAPEEFEKVKTGEKSIPQVKREMKAKEPQEPQRITEEFSDGLMFADMAISQMERIHPKDKQRGAAFDRMQEWISKNKQ